MALLLPDKDPFGAAVKDYFEGNKKGKIRVFSNITTEEKMSAKYLFRTINTLPTLEKLALESCYGKVLDIGAGAGSHSIILQNRGFDVTALDISQLNTQVIKKRGIRKVINSDIFEFSGKKFDTLLLLMNGIGLAGNLEGLNSLLCHFRKLLNPGGQIIFDSSDIDYLYTDNEGGRWVNLNNEYYGEVIYQLKYKKIYGKKFNWLFIDFEKARNIAAQNGYTIKLLAKGDYFDYLAKLIPENLTDGF